MYSEIPRWCFYCVISVATVFVGSIGIFKIICSTVLQLEIKINLHMNQENLNLKIGSITDSLYGIGQIIFLFSVKFIICLFHISNKSVNLQCFERYLALLLTLLTFLWELSENWMMQKHLMGSALLCVKRRPLCRRSRPRRDVLLNQWSRAKAFH